jgi:hypothetical protein
MLAEGSAGRIQKLLQRFGAHVRASFSAKISHGWDAAPVFAEDFKTSPASARSHLVFLNL